MEQQIISAFTHRQRPDSVCDIVGNSTLSDDSQHFLGLNCAAITAQDWRQWSDAFFGFSPKAFLYFLPSLLTASLNKSNLPLVAADALISSLDTSAEPNIWSEWFADRFTMLTLPELRALQDWVGTYLKDTKHGEGSEFVRVQDTLAMLMLMLDG